MKQCQIKRQFIYIEKQLEELNEHIINVSLKNSDDWLSQKVADIFNNLNKCLDWCSTDIYETLIKVNVGEKELKKIDKKLQGKTPYFPIYKTQLEGLPYSYLKKTNPPLHDYLLSLTRKVYDKRTNPNSNINYSLLKKIRVLCNQDKHYDALDIRRSEGKSKIVTGLGLTVRLSGALYEAGHLDIECFDDQSNPCISYICSSFGVSIENNKYEITDLCNTAFITFKSILKEIYRYIDNEVIIL